MKKDHFSLSNMLATCYFIGYTPFAPGTAASIIAMLTLYFLPPISIITHFAILNILFLVGAVVCEQVMIATGEKDPSSIVIDEWFGMWLALFLAPHNFWIYLLALVMFRIFDIIKPWPISYIEKHTPGGLGVMLDDAAAGFAAFVIIQAICMVV